MYHVIVNPEAGKNKNSKTLEKIKKVFDSYGANYVVHKSEHAGAARGIAAALTKRPTENLSFDDLLKQSEQTEKKVKLVVVGDDGTLHEVLNGIYDLSRVELGIIPSGTGNDFAAAAGIPEDVEKAAKLILERPPKETDYLEVDGVRCMNVGGLGIDVDVLVRYQKHKKHTKFTYFKSLLKSVCKYKGTQITVKANGEEKTHTAFVAAACNGSQFGGGIKICPPADPSDGKIDVIVVDYVKGFFGIVGLLFKLVRGKIHLHKKAERFTCDEVCFLTDEPCPLQLDGEIYENLKFEAKLKKGLMIYR